MVHASPTLTPAAARSRTRPGFAGGFSLVEILIVVTIIGILAAIAVPKLANASQMARENSLKDDLRLLRTQIGVYRSQHRDICPGYPAGDPAQTPTAALATDQLLLHTDPYGNTSANGTAPYECGPYLLALPSNPVNGKSTWKVLAPTDSMVPDDTTGWLYQPSTGTIKPNVSGADLEGKPFGSY